MSDNQNDGASRDHRQLYNTDTGNRQPQRRDSFCVYIDDRPGQVGGSLATFPTAPGAPDAKSEGGILPFGRPDRCNKSIVGVAKAVKCEVCYKEFSSPQPGTKYCSNRCRQKAYRLRKK